jgi:hypothetical protein
VELHWTLPRRALSAVALLVTVAVVAIAWARVVRTIQSAHPAPTQARATAVAWGDRVFASRVELARWLRSRGVAYSTWARNHASSAGIIDPSLRKRAAARRSVHIRPHATALKAPVKTPSIIQAAAPSHGHLLRSLLVFAALLVGLFCLLGAVLPRLEPARRAWPGLVRAVPYGTFLVATGAAVLGGLLIALMQG